MPPNRRALIVRRLRQADGSLRRACLYLADVYHTIEEEHPHIAGFVMAGIKQVDRMRQGHRDFCLEYFTGSTRDLWTSDDLSAIMEEAQTLPDPWPKESERLKKRYQEMKREQSRLRQSGRTIRRVLSKIGRNDGDTDGTG